MIVPMVMITQALIGTMTFKHLTEIHINYIIKMSKILLFIIHPLEFLIVVLTQLLALHLQG